MFEHFTNTAIAVLMEGQNEARRTGHGFLGSEQILLGILKENNSFAASVLSEHGINLTNARAEDEAMTEHGAGSPEEIPFTPEAALIFERAFQAARARHDPYIQPKHILLALTESTESVAYRVMENLFANSCSDINVRLKSDQSN